MSFESNPNCIGFALLRSVIGLENARHSQPIIYKTKTNHDAFSRALGMSVPTKTPPIQYPPRDHPLEVKKKNYPASLKPLSPNSATVPPSLAPDSLRNELVSPSDQAKQRLTS